MLATPEAARLHGRVLEAWWSQHAGGSTAREAISLAAPWPISGRAAIDVRRTDVAAALEFAEQAPESFQALRQTLAGLKRPARPGGKYGRVIHRDRGRGDDATMQPLSAHVHVLLKADHEQASDYDVFPSVTWVGAPRPPPAGWLVVARPGPLASLVPEAALARAALHTSLIERVVAVSTIEARIHIAARLAVALDGAGDVEDLASALPHGPAAVETLRALQDGIWSRAADVQSDAEQVLHAGVAEARPELDGEQLLKLLGDEQRMRKRLAGEVMAAVDDARAAGRVTLEAWLEPAALGRLDDPFEPGITCTISRRWLDDVAVRLGEAISLAERDREHGLTRRVAPLIDPLRQTASALADLDALLAVAAWSRSSGLVLPEIASSEATGIRLRGGRHLDLGLVADPVDHGFGAVAHPADRQQMALLSGANSGGKTTLLELLAQVQILAQLGLPVPDGSATVALVDAVHVLGKPTGTQNTGALEATLTRLAGVIISDTLTLLLADELEAITEPGAAARIMAGLLTAAAARPSMTVLLVTHVADRIAEASQFPLRVDGIEVSGLDADLQFIVGRTPRRNHLARSTPELIVRRLVERGGPAAAEVFRAVLDGFEASTD